MLSADTWRCVCKTSMQPCTCMFSKSPFFYYMLLLVYKKLRNQHWAMSANHSFLHFYITSHLKDCQWRCRHYCHSVNVCQCFCSTEEFCWITVVAKFMQLASKSLQGAWLVSQQQLLTGTELVEGQSLSTTMNLFLNVQINMLFRERHVLINLP